MNDWDAIVVGVGAMGAAACWQLTQQGARVLGLEQHSIAHNLGSSHGQSRLIRKAYFEHPDYVPLLHRAYELWDKLSEATGQSLLQRTGLVMVGLPNSEEVIGAKQSAILHQLPLQEVSQDFSERFPQFRLPPGFAAVFEPDGGWLAVESCVSAMAHQALLAGAQIHQGEQVTSFQADGEGVKVQTNRAQYSAARLVIAQGAWSEPLLRELDMRFTVHRNVLLWLEVEPSYWHQLSSAPCFGFSLPTGFFYGFPALETQNLENKTGTIKVALHRPGQITHPDTVDRSLYPKDTHEVLAFAEQHLVGVKPVVRHHAVCLYEMSSNGHFVIGKHPRWPQMVILAGFSGHGFKFAPVVGEIAADLALTGKTLHPINLFRFE